MRSRVSWIIVGAVVLVGVLAGVDAFRSSGSETAVSTAKEPTTTDEVWSLERIRAEGSPENQTVTESGITTRAYVVCDGPRSACKSDPPLRVPYQHAALEVTQDGRSALFGVGANGEDWAAGFDADSVFVMDDPDDVGGLGGDPEQVRYRLLRADGTEVQLQFINNPAT